VIAVRAARPSDAALIHALIGELADYENLRGAMTATEADIAALLFGPSPRAFCDIAELNGAPVGFSVWCYNVSTFAGRHGIYVEDLYVRESARGQGAGPALLKTLARRCVEEGLGRLEWEVLDWNTPAIGFYDRIGSVAASEWLLRRLSGEALARLAGE